jgi:multiple antibiotic resistance protein
VKAFWICFVPIFVAVDAFGVLPMFLGFTEDMDSAKVRRIIYQSVITASIVALAFLAVGIAVFKLLGITIADFLVAGGTLLFAISLSDLFNLRKDSASNRSGKPGGGSPGCPSDYRACRADYCHSPDQ